MVPISFISSYNQRKWIYEQDAKLQMVFNNS